MKLLSSYSKGVRESLKARFADINDLSLFDVLHPSRVPKPDDPTFGDFGVKQIHGMFDMYGKDIDKRWSSLSCVTFGLNIGPV